METVLFKLLGLSSGVLLSIIALSG